MLYYDRIDISKGTDPTKSNRSKECETSIIGFSIMDSHFKILYAMVVMIWQLLSVNISDSITIKNVDYSCVIHNISKSEAIHLWKHSVIEDHGYTYKKYCLNF